MLIPPQRVFERMKKHILQLIVNYDVKRGAKEVKFSEVGKSGISFRLSCKPCSLVKKIFVLKFHLIMTC